MPPAPSDFTKLFCDPLELRCPSFPEESKVLHLSERNRYHLESECHSGHIEDLKKNFRRPASSKMPLLLLPALEPLGRPPGGPVSSRFQCEGTDTEKITGKEREGLATTTNR